MKKLSFKATLAGLVTLIVLDSLGEALLTVAFTGGLSGDAVRAVSGDTMFLMLRTLVGVLSIVVGGYVLAKLAKTSIYFSAAIVGILSLVLAALSYDVSLPAWFTIIGLLFPLPATLLGAYFAKRKILASG